MSGRSNKSARSTRSNKSAISTVSVPPKIINNLERRNSATSIVYIRPKSEKEVRKNAENVRRILGEEPRPDWRRWYVMLLYALSNFMVQMSFNSFSPIANSLQTVFGWSSQIIPSFSLVTWLFFVILVLPIGWLVNRYGTRKYVIFSNVMLSGGMILRCIPYPSGHAFMIASEVQNLIGSIGASGAMMVPAVITAQWFPQKEWRLATSVGMFLQILGGSVAYKLGPAIVPEPGEGSSNDLIKHRIYYYYYGITAACIAVCVWTIIYFPAKPKVPPSNVAQRHETNEDGRTLKDNVIQLVTAWRYWVLVGRCMLIGAMSAAVSGLLFPFLMTLGIDQDYAGTMGFAQSLVSIPVAIGIGKLGDLAGNNLKSIIVACTVLALEGATWLFLMGRDVIAVTDRSVFFATTLYIVFGGSTLGLVIELGCDCLYPIPEAYVASGIMFSSATIGVLFSALMMDPDVSSNNVDLVIFVCTVLGTIFACFLPNNYARSKAEGQNKEHNSTN